MHLLHWHLSQSAIIQSFSADGGKNTSDIYSIHTTTLVLRPTVTKLFVLHHLLGDQAYIT